MRKSFYNVRMRRSWDLREGFATPPKNVRDFERFQDFRNDFTGFQDFTGGFQSMRKSFYNVRMRRSRAILNTRFRRFHGIYGRFQDFAKDFKISRKISLEVYEISASGEPLVLT